MMVSRQPHLDVITELENKVATHTTRLNRCVYILPFAAAALAAAPIATPSPPPPPSPPPSPQSAAMKFHPRAFHDGTSLSGN